jgi:hypothetical protein
MGWKDLSLHDGSYERKLAELTNDPELQEFTIKQFKELAPPNCRPFPQRKNQPK